MRLPISPSLRQSVIVTLVLSCNVSEILQVFVLMILPLFHPILVVYSLEKIADVGVHPSRHLKLFSREIIFEVFQPVITVPERHRQTDDILWH